MKQAENDLDTRRRSDVDFAAAVLVLPSGRDASRAVNSMEEEATCYEGF